MAKGQNSNLKLFPGVEPDTPTPEQVEDRVLTGAYEAFTFGGRRPTQCFTLKMPFPVYLTFKAEIKRLRDEAEQLAPQTKELYTMTNYINSAVKNIIIPGLKRLSVEPEEESPAK